MEKLSHELGRYKKKCADQHKEIEKLKEQIAGYEQITDVNHAMIAAVIEQTGSVSFARQRITEIIKDCVHVIVDYDADSMAYTLRMMGGETDGGSPTEQN